MIFQDYGIAAGVLMFILVFAIVILILGIALAVWVYKDAKKRDMNAAVWLLVVLLTGCIGCIIYLIVRD